MKTTNTLTRMTTLTEEDVEYNVPSKQIAVDMSIAQWTGMLQTAKSDPDLPTEVLLTSVKQYFWHTVTGVRRDLPVYIINPYCVLCDYNRAHKETPASGCRECPLYNQWRNIDTGEYTEATCVAGASPYEQLVHAKDMATAIPYIEDILSSMNNVVIRSTPTNA